MLQQIPKKYRVSWGHTLNLYFTNLENLKEADEFSDAYDLP